MLADCQYSLRVVLNQRESSTAPHKEHGFAHELGFVAPPIAQWPPRSVECPDKDLSIRAPFAAEGRHLLIGNGGAGRQIAFIIDGFDRIVYHGHANVRLAIPVA